MKRSRAVPLSLVATVATVALAGCSGPQTMRCTDSGGRVVADSLCRTAANAAEGTGAEGTRAGGGFYPSPFLWYFGGRMARGYVSGGSYQAVPGRSYRSGAGITYRTPGGTSGGRVSGGARSGGVSRGGFGATGAGRGGFGG
jgi:hypothetical protein